MTVTSGPSSQTPFATFDPDSSFWKTLQRSFLHPSGEPFSGTWPKQGSIVDGRAYAHPTLALRTDESGCSLLPTPARAEGDRASLTYGRGNPTLRGALMPTPTVNDSRGGRNRTSGRSNPDSKHHDGVTLVDAVILLPTPAAGNFNDGESVESWTARNEKLRAQGINGNGMGTPLAVAVKLLPTPRTSDSNGGGAHGSGGLDLRTAVADTQHQGPIRAEARVFASESGERSAVDWGVYAPAIARWERTLGRPAPDRLDERGRLNVDLVTWMMGAPENWTGDLSRTAALKGLGNGVVVQVAEAVGRWALS